MRTFEEINRLRTEHGLTRRDVYKRAGVNGETWRRTANETTEPNQRTLRKLSSALDELIAERQQA